ncbi:MAG: tRNA (cytidine(56)-2'-O)-methyltransferase [archaeon]
MVKEIIVLRYGHRDVRDYRVTTHCALVSRALGAKKILIEGDGDNSIKKTVEDVVNRWGGDFKIEFTPHWKTAFKELKKKGFIFVHLTMYGSRTQDVEKKISKKDKLCIIVGSQKVEREVYDVSDFNVGVTAQPHSEIGALAVFLDRVQNGKELENKFKGAKRRIEPQERGKKVISLK